MMNNVGLKLARLTHLISKDKYNEKCNIALIEASPLFNKEWYLEKNPDVKKKKVRAAKHYLKMGYKEKRNPSPYFDGNDYLNRYKDVAEAGVNPLLHYLISGAKEGKTYNGVKKSSVIKKMDFMEKLKYALTYPIRVKEEYDRLKAEIEALKSK